ncbi:MAG: flagellar hook-length control protein FliK [Negativicutes bacterium]|nr:flagellar hook-length control protein FliK [Negativicutes bacterium]
MNGAIMPFVADVQPVLPAAQLPGKTADNGKAQNGSDTFSGIFSAMIGSTTTAKTPTKNTDTKDSADPKAKASDADNQGNTALAMPYVVPQQAPMVTSVPTIDPAAVTSAVGAITGTTSTNAALNLSAASNLSAIPATTVLTPAVSLPANSPLLSSSVDTSTMSNLVQTSAQPALPAGTVVQLPSVNSLPTLNQSTQTPPVLQPSNAAVSTDLLSSNTPIAANLMPTDNVQATAQPQQTLPGLTTTVMEAPQTVQVPQINQAATLPQRAKAEPVSKATDLSTPAIDPVTLPAKAMETVASQVPAHSQNPVAVAAQPPAPVSQTNPAAVQTAEHPVVAAATHSDAFDNKNDAAFTADDLATIKAAPEKTDSVGTISQFAGILDQQAAKTDQAASTVDASQATRPDPYNIAGQIVEQAKLISRPQNTEMIIKLKPEHLGELTMRIVVANGAVSATFHSSNPEVRGALESSLVQLRQELASQGLKVHDVGVYTSLNQFSSNDQRGNSQQQVIKVSPKLRDDQSFVEAADAIAATDANTASSGVDYRI